MKPCLVLISSSFIVVPAQHMGHHSSRLHSYNVLRTIYHFANTTNSTEKKIVLCDISLEQMYSTSNGWLVVDLVHWMFIVAEADDCIALRWTGPLYIGRNSFNIQQF